jgi:hypothetical protein
MKNLLQIGGQTLQAAQKWARNLRQAAGKSRPEAVRQDRATVPSSLTAEAAASFYGFRPIATRGPPVSDEFVNQLRDEAGV